MNHASSTTKFLKELRSLLRAPYPILHLQTHEEARTLALLAELAAVDGRACHVWTVLAGFDRKPRTTEPCHGFRQALAHVAKTTEPAVFVFADATAFAGDAIARRRLRELAGEAAEGGKSLVFVGPVGFQGIAELDKDVTTLSVPLPDRALIRIKADEVFEPATAYAGLDYEAIVSGAMGLTTAEAHRAFHRLRLLYEESLTRNAPFDAGEAVLSEKRRMLQQSEVLEFHPLSDAMRDVGGLDELKRWLAERKKAFGQAARAYGLPAPKGLLLVGVQGCGKSLTAKVIGHHWGLPLLRLDFGAIFDGARAPEQALREALETCAALAPCVLWMDEIEKGFSQEAASNRVLGSLLVWQQETPAPVFMVATANGVQDLPPELLRKGRFDEIFFIDLPEPHERREILDIHIAKRGRSFPPEVVEDVANRAEHFSGAELESVVVAAMHSAFADDREVQPEDLAFAVRETVPLYRTYEEDIKRLREWASGRARRASRVRRVADYFE